MATTTNGFPYPSGSDAPDGPGAIYNLANYLDGRYATTTTGTWTPGISGSGGATQGGAGSGSVGKYARQADLYRFVGTIIFGSGATFGNGDTTITNLPASIDTGSANGTGWYNNNSGGIQQVFFVAATATTMRLYQPVQGSFQYFSGAIPTGARLSFTINGTL